MKNNFLKLSDYDFLWAMTEKEIKIRYKSTVFGFLWMMINPLFQMIIIGVVFSNFLKLYSENYFLFLFSGLLPWQFFSLSLPTATYSYISERNLLQKAKFPIWTIPISIVTANFIHLVMAELLLLVILAVYGSLTIKAIGSLLFALLLLLIFTVGISLLLSSLQVRYRDIGFMLKSILFLWFYATPVIYSLEIVPSNLKLFFLVNPLTIIFELFHFSVGGKITLDIFTVVTHTVILFLIFCFGCLVFNKEKKYFVDLI